MIIGWLEIHSKRHFLSPYSHVIFSVYLPFASRAVSLEFLVHDSGSLSGFVHLMASTSKEKKICFFFHMLMYTLESPVHKSRYNVCAICSCAIPLSCRCKVPAGWKPRRSTQNWLHTEVSYTLHEHWHKVTFNQGDRSVSCTPAPSLQETVTPQSIWPVTPNTVPDPELPSRVHIYSLLRLMDTHCYL